MTFLDSIKNEIVEAAPKKPCCRRNMLLGLLAARGRTAEDGSTELRLSHKETAALAQHLIKEQFGRVAQKLPSRYGGRNELIGFDSPAAKRFLDDLTPEVLSKPLPKHCPACAPSFLKGLFLAAGRIADPAKAYHMEFSLGARAAFFLPLFEAEYGVTPGILVRRQERLLYFKDSALIEDILTLLGINDAAFLFMNRKIEKQFRNEANRRTNCEAGNITRAVNAAARTLDVLRRMESSGTISQLPEELSDIARLRLSYPEASLSQLASLTTPPLTKSGVNHRLQKIMELAEKIHSQT